MIVCTDADAVQHVLRSHLLQEWSSKILHIMSIISVYNWWSKFHYTKWKSWKYETRWSGDEKENTWHAKLTWEESHYTDKTIQEHMTQIKSYFVLNLL